MTGRRIAEVTVYRKQQWLLKSQRALGGVPCSMQDTSKEWSVPFAPRRYGDASGG
jgi:hypothetical protein